MPDFPDLHHFEQIRQRLWCGREFGQAAVMVGSGFSCNAEKIVPSTPDLPQWSQLAGQIYDRLYPGMGSKDPLHKEKATSNALALASEYETVFGQDALDALLLSAISDNQYNPGSLHKLLMALPWSDVFTTNYDTLLERTFVLDRKYSLVSTSLDISGKMKPRIVKLHGSFPSHRPFIITEEDYRTYPKKFAPFVNMVQQSIMENVFCLIGFSGDDPNFLNWIGWVRDNLGDSTPNIYLCGLQDNLSEAKKQILRRKHIVTVDISPLFSREDWPDSNLRHAKAIEWFLGNLRNGKPPNVMSWPESSNGNEWTKSDDLPDLMPGPNPIPDPGDLAPYNSSQPEYQLTKQYSIWKETRKAYPGWIICPKSNRDNLWDYTKGWIGPTLRSLSRLSPPEDLFLLYELNWRLETILTPLFSDFSDIAESVLKKYNPYPKILSIEDATIRPNEDKYKTLNWSEIQNGWVELTFAITRSARENHNEARFSEYIEHLQAISSQNPEWKARCFYEKCLFHLSRLEYDLVLTTLKEWPVNTHLDFWNVKRAAILAELGDLEEAERITEEALQSIRFRHQPYSIDYMLLSQEGWTMYLLHVIRSNDIKRVESRSKYFGLFRDRWARLEAFRCDPAIEMEALKQILEREPPSLTPTREQQGGFDYGIVTTTYHYGSEPDIYSVLPAFNFLRMLENTGIPLRCGDVIPFISGMRPARWIRPYNPLWSMTTFIRANNSGETEVNRYVNISYLASIDQNTIDYWHERFDHFLTHASQDLSLFYKFELTPKFETLLLILELNSRICFRLNDEQLKKLLKFNIYASKSLLSQDISQLRDKINNLFKRVLNALSLPILLQELPILLALPIPEDRISNIEDRFNNFPEPFSELKLKKNLIVDKTLRTRLSVSINNLVLIIRNGSDKARSRAILRLERLYHTDLLTKAEQKSFADALWSKLDEQYHLPLIDSYYKDSHYLKFAVLQFPEMQEGTASQKLSNFLLNNDFSPEHNDFFREWLGATAQTVFDHGSSINWTSDEVKRLLAKVLEWWTNEKKYYIDLFSYPTSHSSDSIRKKISDLINLIAYVILPRVSDVKQELKNQINETISELDGFGFYNLPNLSMGLFIEPTNSEKVAQIFRERLTASSEIEVDKAIESLFYWLAYSRNDQIPKPPSDLIDDLVSRVNVRRQPGLYSAIKWVSNIVSEMPELLTQYHLDSFVLGLKYLLLETKFPDFADLETALQSKPLIPVLERRDYRQVATKLVCRLYHLYENQNKDLPPILLEWKNISENDVLPEVRKIWQ
jgi:SIR2-like domain